MDENDILEAMDGEEFIPEEEETQDTFEPLPPGWYNCQIEKAECKETKAGDGYYIKLQLTVLDECYENRKLFDQINIKNPSQECQEIGRRTLATIGQALGIKRINSSSQLIDEYIQVKVKVKPSDGIYEAGNEIRGYKAVDTGEKPEEPAEEAEPEPAPEEKPEPKKEAVSKKQATAKKAGKKTPPWLKK